MGIPCHLIAGALGVGKTTAIRRFVAQSPDYTAVLVNDFGETGYDAAIIGEAGTGKLRVENVPGGCLCCTSAAQLLPALKMLCAKPEVDRIIVEPSGVALLDPLLKMLHDAEEECGFELAPVIVLFDPAKTRPATLKLIPYWKHLADRADIVVANRCDLAPPQAVEDFVQYFEQSSKPQRSCFQTSEGKLPLEMFELRGHVAKSGEGHHHHAELPPAGTFRSDKIFQLEKLVELLEEIAPQTERFKGIFQTDHPASPKASQGRCGWVRLEIANGTVIQKEASPASQSSADWIGSFDINAHLAECSLSGL